MFGIANLVLSQKRLEHLPMKSREPYTRDAVVASVVLFDAAAAVVFVGDNDGFLRRARFWFRLQLLLVVHHFNAVDWWGRCDDRLFR